jgi:hypothetical protein
MTSATYVKLLTSGLEMNAPGFESDRLYAATRAQEANQIPGAKYLFPNGFELSESVDNGARNDKNEQLWTMMQ